MLGLGSVLLAFGLYGGYRYGWRRGSSSATPPAIDDGRLLLLLRDLSTWTSEYSGSVTQYEGQLSQIRDSVRGAMTSPGDSSGKRITELLEQIMESNRELKHRLDAAEKQLADQTKQLETYVSEARTDALTGLDNRRAFDRELDQRFSIFRRGGQSFCIALVDIDKFKQINDRFGHPAGDEVLRQVAKLLRSELQGTFCVARFGGEEFAILLPPPLRTAAEAVDKVRKVLSRQPIAVDSRTLDVTISCGVAEPKDDKMIGPLVRRADESLYAAKGMGRNRTYFHDGRQPVLYGAPEVKHVNS
jgi:diguanylate cyclase